MTQCSCEGIRDKYVPQNGRPTNVLEFSILLFQASSNRSSSRHNGQQHTLTHSGSRRFVGKKNQFRVRLRTVWKDIQVNITSSFTCDWTLKTSFHDVIISPCFR